MILGGIWQGKGKPPFHEYMKAFSDVLVHMYNEGVTFTDDSGEKNTVKLAVICSLVDLLAKAGLLNVIQFNGEYACITCEEPGIVAKQGEGHARYFPYRSVEEQPNPWDVLIYHHMQMATPSKRVMGFKGPNGINFTCFSLTKGFVSEYMRGTLLGVTNTLMCLSFSPARSGKPFFIGKKLKEISKPLCEIKPLDHVQRLPRDIETHYSSLKARKYEAWLLYYCIPCVVGILPHVYLDHFSLLSEAIYLLLGDSITNADIDRAQSLLLSFYEDFEDLYGQGSCGLNVCNIGVHLVNCVKMWGPL